MYSQPREACEKRPNSRWTTGSPKVLERQFFKFKPCSHFSLGQENEMNLGLVVALKFWLAGNDTYFAKRQVGFAISFRVYGGEDICRWFFCQAVLITSSILFC